MNFNKIFILGNLLIIGTVFFFPFSASAQILSTSTPYEIPQDQLPLPIDFSQGIPPNPHNPSSIESGLKQLTEGDFYDSNPDWSPDGNTIIFNSNRRLLKDPCNLIYVQDIYGVKPNESDPKTTIYSILQPQVLVCWSNGFAVPKFEKPSNTKILTMEISWIFEYMRTETAGKPLPVLRTRIDGTDENNQSLLRIPYGGYQIISQDGATLAWEVFHYPTYSEVRMAPTISIIPGPIGQFGQSAASQGRVVFSINGRLQGISFSPDGQKIAVSAAKAGQGYDIYIVNSDGTGVPQQLTISGQTQGIHNVQPSWSADNRIAFSSNQTGRFEIYTITPDGTNLKQITDNGGFAPTWSPDASKIAFVSNRLGLTKQNIWMVEAAINQPPVISNLGQFKSDSATQIQEGQTTTENAVVFKSFLSDPDNDQVKLEIELRQFQESFTGEYDGGILSSDFVPSNSMATIQRFGLSDGSYKWRARAIDDKGNKSEWQEYGQVGNVDFKVKTVPLYTQIYSPYPSTTTTFIWSQQNYAYAIPEKPYDGCGFTIGDCGCAITSEIMIMRFYGITTTIDGKNVDPGTFNEWSISNNGYYPNGDVKWQKINDYSKDQFGISRLVHSGPVNSENMNILNGQLDNLQPTILNTQVLNRQGKLVDHFIVADGKLSNTYTVKDPIYYLTKNLNQARSSYIYNYDNHFVGLRLFSPIAVLPDSISAHLASPGELLFIDSLGRKLGKDPIKNVEYNEIPNGIYYQESIGNPESDIAPEKSKNIWIPEPIDGKYEIQVIGVESGIYTLSTLIYDQTGQSKDAVQEGNTSVNNIQNFELNYSAASVQQSEIYRIVNIDIKPGSYPNSINLKSKGVTPVAILTNPFFNAKDVTIDSVVFAGAKPAKGNFEDVDSDGDSDLILHFNTQSLKLNPDDSEAVLTGELTNGNLIKGIDFVRIIQGVVRQTILEKLLSYINQFIPNLVGAISLAAIQ